MELSDIYRRIENPHCHYLFILDSWANVTFGLIMGSRGPSDHPIFAADPSHYVEV